MNTLSFPYGHFLRRAAASVICSLSSTVAIWMAECPCSEPTSTMKRGMPSMCRMSWGNGTGMSWVYGARYPASHPVIGGRYS